MVSICEQIQIPRIQNYTKDNHDFGILLYLPKKLQNQNAKSRLIWIGEEGVKIITRDLS